MGEPAEIKIGDAEKALKEADAKVDHVYRTPRYNHNAIEPHASVAYWTEDGTLVVLDATQCLLRELIGGFPRDSCHLVRKGLRQIPKLCGLIETHIVLASYPVAAIRPPHFQRPELRPIWGRPQTKRD